ncbi:MAG: RNA polymerase sigma factor [Solirubrobacteraceae bacterium]
MLAASRVHPDAFMVFYERYEAAVIGYLLRRTRDAELAVDLASEAFAAALAAADRYRPDRDSAAAWLFTVAQNILTDSVRRGRVEARARQRLGIRDAIVYTDDELERIEATVSQREWAERLLERLPSDQREAVRARILDEQPYGEIAQTMQTSELVVRKRVSRGLAALREQIEPERP